jgi:hypothetical protein
MTRDEKKRRFFRALAEFLAGPNQAAWSIMLEVGGASPRHGSSGWAAQEWAKVRNASRLFGYPTVEEAEKELMEFFG